MSENDTKAADEAEDATFDAIEEELAAEEANEPADDEAEATRRPMGTATIAWGALFLALIGVAGVGYVILDDSGENQVLNDARIAVDNLRADVNQANATIEALRAEIRAAEAAAGSAGDDNATLERELERLGRELDERSDERNSMFAPAPSIRYACRGAQANRNR